MVIRVENGPKPRPPDYGQRLMMAFARRHPWRFAFLFYLALLGSFTFTNDVLVGGRLQPPLLRYVMPLVLLSPYLFVIARRRMYRRATT